MTEIASIRDRRARAVRGRYLLAAGILAASVGCGSEGEGAPGAEDRATGGSGGMPSMESGGTAPRGGTSQASGGSSATQGGESAGQSGAASGGAGQGGSSEGGANPGGDSDAGGGGDEAGGNPGATVGGAGTGGQGPTTGGLADAGSGGLEQPGVTCATAICGTSEVCCRDRAADTYSCAPLLECPVGPDRAELRCDTSYPVETGGPRCCFDTFEDGSARASLADACGASHLEPTITVVLCAPGFYDCSGDTTCQPARFDDWLPEGYHACL